MGFAFEGFTTAEFQGETYSCAGGLDADIVGYLRKCVCVVCLMCNFVVPSSRGRPTAELNADIAACVSVNKT